MKIEECLGMCKLWTCNEVQSHWDWWWNTRSRSI